MKVVENHGIVKPQYKLTLYHSTANYLYMRVAVGREPNYMAPATESFMSTHFLSWRQKLTTEISDWISRESLAFRRWYLKKGYSWGEIKQTTARVLKLTMLTILHEKSGHFC